MAGISTGMTEKYEEIFDGESIIRHPPSSRHEEICDRLHTHVAAIIEKFPSAILLARRSVIQIGPGSILRPDLAVVTRANNRLLLVAEIIVSGDHKNDTVIKKTIYEDSKIPRLWMIDARYDNVEVYVADSYGLTLK